MRCSHLLNPKGWHWVHTIQMYRSLGFAAALILLVVGCQTSEQPSGHESAPLASPPASPSVRSPDSPDPSPSRIALSAVSATPASPDPGSEQEVQFPLSVADSGTHLVDASGFPFHIQGDAAWSLLAQLDHAEVSVYAATRSRQGFNTLMVNLVESHFSDDPPKDAEGTNPFIDDASFASPNPKYFDEAHSKFQELSELGFLILVAPAYLGFAGTDEGWISELERTETAACAEYGRFVSERFGDLRNIVWMAGGDMSPEPGSGIEACMLAMFEAIRATDPEALITGHWRPETDSLSQQALAHLMDLNGVYTYGPTDQACREAHSREPGLPLFLLETRYDREYGAPQFDQRVATNAAALTCTAGFIHGTGGVWQFSDGWQLLLDSQAVAAVSTALSTIRSLDWTAMHPTEGGIISVRPALASEDGAVILAYVSDGQEVVLDGPGPIGLESVWIDPVTGVRIPAGVLLGPSGGAILVPPGPNSVGDRDWVLLLRAPPA